MARTPPVPDVAAQRTRLHVILNAPTSTALQDLVDRKDINTTEAIHQAVAALKFMDDAASRGARVQVVEPDGRVVEFISFR